MTYASEKVVALLVRCFDVIGEKLPKARLSSFGSDK